MRGPLCPTRWHIGCAGVVLALLSASASAHSSVAGLGGFGSGFLHPLLDPALLLATVVCALLIGQHGFEASRPAIPMVATGLAVGLLLTGLGHGMASSGALLAASAVGGIMVAIGRRWPGAVYALLAILLGVGIGLGSEPDGASGLKRIVTLLGTFAGACIWIVDGAVLVQALKKPWLRVLVRVVASWMTACALLVLALQWAPTRAMPQLPAPSSGAITERLGA